MTDVGGPRMTPECERCQDTGWIPIEDPIVGALILTRCPDCWEENR